MMQDMKDSGIKWIGEIPAEWELNKIKYIAVLKGRIGWQGLTSEEYTDDGAYLITGTDFENGSINWDSCVHVPMKRWEEARDIQIENGDLLITKDGTIGKVAIVSGCDAPTSLNSGVLRISLVDGYDRRFLFWVLQSEVFWSWFTDKNAGNSTIQHLYQGDFAEFKYAIPPLAEQQAIANFLDAKCAKLDSIIADLERQIEVLQEYKDSVITTAMTKGLDDSVAMHDSGLEWIGEIPDGWKLSRIKYLIDANHPYPIGDGDHGLVSVDDYLTEGIPYIRVLNLTWGNGLKMDNMVYISEDMNYKIRNSTLRPNDLLIAKTGATIGKTAIVPHDMLVSNTTSHVGKITLPDNHCPNFFFHMLNSSIIQKQIGDISAMQSTRPELGIEGLKNLVVIVPPFDEQKKIAAYLDIMCEKSNNVLNEKYYQLDKINNYKSSLIYEYVTGKKRVKEAAIHAD
ncbi:MAG: restriction endonuclease subunit S [Selenomonas sp.]|nr:restriction endonuclease subunit S [Selenomonas sp.]